MYVICTCILCVRMYTWSPKVGVGPPAITLLTFWRQGLSLNKELIDSVWLACEIQGGTCLCPLTPPAATRLQAPATIGAGTSAPYACLAGTLYTTPKTTGKKKKTSRVHRGHKRTDYINQKGGVSSAKNNNWVTTVYQELFMNKTRTQA